MAEDRTSRRRAHRKAISAPAPRRRSSVSGTPNGPEPCSPSSCTHPAAAVAMRLWGRLHGLVSLEIYGHLRPQVQDPARIYPAELVDLTYLLGRTAPVADRGRLNRPASLARRFSAAASREASARERSAPCPSPPVTLGYHCHFTPKAGSEGRRC
ncbi:TetR-like C-terminal domain-containing protein [Streptomyces sp. NPDC096040]|uniref:TetR-like C-terminal domain-containing protein n=1 Tax=Streptomyces sp. NPDC096040 TaxID=3155541 RepID=UPI0033200898